MKTGTAPLSFLASAALLAGCVSPSSDPASSVPEDDESKALPAAVAAGDTVDLPVFGKVTVIDAVDCAAAEQDHLFEEYPAGGSAVTNLLGRPGRALPVQEKGSSMLKWRLGEGVGLKPNGAYVVVVYAEIDRTHHDVIGKGVVELEIPLLLYRRKAHLTV